jgi:import inner membrane translocase subunit TIM23
MTSRGIDDNQESTSGGGRLYNPYADLHGALDGKNVGNLYRIPDAPEFLFTEEAAVHRRSWSDNLTYWTGGGYLAGKNCMFI